VRAVNEEVEGYYLLSLVRQGWGTLMMMGGTVLFVMAKTGRRPSPFRNEK